MPTSSKLNIFFADINNILTFTTIYRGNIAKKKWQTVKIVEDFQDSCRLPRPMQTIMDS